MGSRPEQASTDSRLLAARVRYAAWRSAVSAATGSCYQEAATIASPATTSGRIWQGMQPSLTVGMVSGLRAYLGTSLAAFRLVKGTSSQETLAMVFTFGFPPPPIRSSRETSS